MKMCEIGFPEKSSNVIKLACGQGAWCVSSDISTWAKLSIWNGSCDVEFPIAEDTFIL